MKAKQLMTKDPKTCAPDHDVLCALRIMKDEDCGIVPVTEGNGHTRVVGVVTDRDIALHLGSVDKKPSDVQVRDVMSTNLVSCATGDEDSQISRLMQKAQVRRVLVCEDGRLEGVISTADLARASGSGKDLGEQVRRVIVEVSQ